jgi:hypothetical protein
MTTLCLADLSGFDDLPEDAVLGRARPALRRDTAPEPEPHPTIATRAPDDPG